MAFGEAPKVYIGHGNVYQFVAYADVATGELLDMSGVTLVEVCIGGAKTDSTQTPAAVHWHEHEETPGEWELHLKLGLVPGLVEGEQTLRITAYDNDYPEGLVLTDDYEIDVVGGC